ncbi:MAG: hypothetical protein JW772_03365 [Candidatus Diapherotrites archaeon]|nr:hypothetical protein [Candidatus Diapherotrites archaeon]
MVVKGYFIQYKFIIPSEIKHSSYTYQKLFRALYGYTQAVFKSNGKSYRYHRRGVLSDVPYLRPGKNCVITPQGALTKLLDFFKTGKNPAHLWKWKGDWKAVYYMNEKNIEDREATKALEESMERQYVLSASESHENLASEMSVLLQKQPSGIDKNYAALLSKEAEKLVSLDWFKQLYSKSEKLSNFYNNYKKLKAMK